MTHEYSSDKHITTLNAIAQYAKPTEQKNTTTVEIISAKRNTK